MASVSERTGSVGLTPREVQSGECLCRVGQVWEGTAPLTLSYYKVLVIEEELFIEFFCFFIHFYLSWLGLGSLQFS